MSKPINSHVKPCVRCHRRAARWGQLPGGYFGWACSACGHRELQR